MGVHPVHRTTVPYATRRFKQHLGAFEELRRGVLDGSLSEAYVAALESRTPLFPRIEIDAWR